MNNLFLGSIRLINQKPGKISQMDPKKTNCSFEDNFDDVIKIFIVFYPLEENKFKYTYTRTYFLLMDIKSKKFFTTLSKIVDL